jgi:hypothetical protein
MKTTLLVLAPLLGIASGCSSVVLVEADYPASWIAAAQDDLLNENATVTFVGDVTAEGRITGLSADSLLMRRRSGGELIGAPLDRVLFVAQARNRTALVGGMVGGALLGGAISASIAEPDAEPGAISIGASVDGCIIGVCAGAVVGGIVMGAATEVRDYQFLRSARRGR